MSSLSEAEYAFYTSNTSAASSTITSATLSAGTSVQLLAADPTRMGATIYNGTGSTVYLAFGPTASATAFTVPLLAGAYFELPFRYRGAVSAFCATASVSPHMVTTSIAA